MALKYKDKSMASAKSVRHIIYNSQLVHELKQGNSVRWEEIAGTYETGTLPEHVASLTCYRTAVEPSITSVTTLSSGDTLYNNDILRFSATSDSQYYSVTVPTGTYNISTLYSYQVEKTYPGVTLSGVYVSPVMRSVACNKSTPATGVTSYVVSYYADPSTQTTKTINVSGALGTMISAFSGKTVSWSSPTVSSGYKLLQTSGEILPGTSSAAIAPKCYAYDWYDIWSGFSVVSKTLTQSSGYTATMTDIWTVGGLDKYDRLRVSGTVIIAASNGKSKTISFENIELTALNAYISLGAFTMISLTTAGGLSGEVYIGKSGTGFRIYTTNTWTGTYKAKLTSMTVNLTSVQVYVPFDLSDSDIIYDVNDDGYDIYVDTAFFPCDLYVLGDIEWTSSVMSTGSFTKADSINETDEGDADVAGYARGWISPSIVQGDQESISSVNCYIALANPSGSYMVSTMYHYEY